MINKDLIKTDLYEAVNAEYLSKLEIPSDKKSIGAFALIDMNIEKQLLEDFNTLKFDDEFVTKEMQNYLKFYRSIVENKNRNLHDKHPVYEMINRILSIKNNDDLNKIITELRKFGVGSLFNIEIYPSFMDSNKEILYMDVPATILPSKEYYLDKDKKDKYIPIFKDCMLKIFDKFGIENAENILSKALNLDEKIVEYVRTSVELADYTKLYNVVEYSDFIKYSEVIDFDYYIQELINKEIGEMSISQPRFFENINKLYSKENLDELKALILVKFLFKISDLFDEELRLIKAEYQNAILGIKEAKNTEKFAYEKGMQLFSQVVGLYYGHKYFGEDAKKDVLEMVNNIIEMYKVRLQEKEWLQKSTKEKAILKLSTINVMMAYPDKLPEVYTKLSFDENLSLYENYFNNAKIHSLDRLSKYGEAVDHTIWGMPASMVNAYYNPSSNLICFPAAILNKPFYSLEQSKSENYGGIGAVIAHEISHAFDNNGANFDENGNMNNWWQESDFAEFKKLTDKMIEQFDGIEINGGKVNGTLVVSENLADVGGLACSLACLKNEKDYNLEEFFINFAKVWAMKGREEYLQYLLETDVHAPAKLRSNIQVTNMDDFFEVFDIKEGDKMFRKKEDRIIVW